MYIRFQLERWDPEWYFNQKLSGRKKRFAY